MGASHIAEVLVELGPLLEIGAIVENDEPGSWTIAMDEARVILADYHEESRRLVLQADVAPLPEVPGIAARLLEFNAAMERNRGIWMALDGPKGTVTQAIELEVDGLTPDTLRGDLETFLERLASWRGMFVRSPGADGDTADGDDPSVRRSGSGADGIGAIKV